jgi:hypothetical protein
MNAQAETLRKLLSWFMEYEPVYIENLLEEGIYAQFTPTIHDSQLNTWCQHHPASAWEWIEFLRKEQRLLLEAYSS